MNLENEENENLINQELDFITFGDHSEEDPEELSQEDPEEDPEELSQEDPEEDPEELSQTQSETQVIDYSNDFLILENLGYIQISMIGALLFYFVLSLVIKFLKSFF